jgi:hypothetical protein
MATSYTTLLGLALPSTGELSGTWGDTVNNYITTYLDASIAGSLTVTANTTLTKTTGGALDATSSQYAVIIASPASANITITAPAASKTYVVNNTSGTYTVTFKATGQTGVTLVANEKCFVAFNGTDFVKVSPPIVSGVVPVSSGGTGVSTSTGSGSVVLSTSPTLVTPILGTPASGNLSSCTSIPVNQATGTLAVANGGTGVISSTGSGSVVLSTSPTLTTPVLGTPASGTLSSCTVDGTNGVGYLNIPQNAQTGSYTTVLSDGGKHIYHASGAGAATYTIAANASVQYPIGTVISFVNLSATSISIAINADTMYWGYFGTTGSRTLGQYGVANALKLTSTTWIITGTALT